MDFNPYWRISWARAWPISGKLIQNKWRKWSFLGWLWTRNISGTHREIQWELYRVHFPGMASNRLYDQLFRVLKTRSGFSVWFGIFASLSYWLNCVTIYQVQSGWNRIIRGSRLNVQDSSERDQTWSSGPWIPKEEVQLEIKPLKVIIVTLSTQFWHLWLFTKWTLLRRLVKWGASSLWSLCPNPAKGGRRPGVYKQLAFLYESNGLWKYSHEVTVMFTMSVVFS